MTSHAPENRDRRERFTKLLTLHKRQLFGCVFALVHTIADAEDVLQQTAVVLWEKFDDFEPGSDFVAWASKIARFRAIDFVRAQSRERGRFSNEVLEQLAEQDVSRSDVTEARAVALESCKKKLSPKDRETLATCYEQGTSIKQAASRMGRPVNSVYVTLTRIRRALWDCIQRKVGEEVRSDV